MIQSPGRFVLPYLVIGHVPPWTTDRLFIVLRILQYVTVQSVSLGFCKRQSFSRVSLLPVFGSPTTFITESSARLQQGKHILRLTFSSLRHGRQIVQWEYLYCNGVPCRGSNYSVDFMDQQKGLVCQHSIMQANPLGPSLSAVFGCHWRCVPLFFNSFTPITGPITPGIAAIGTLERCLIERRGGHRKKPGSEMSRQFLLQIPIAIPRTPEVICHIVAS